MIRRRRLTSSDDPLELVAVVGEAALHRPVGGSAVQRRQLQHLVASAGLDTVTLHVLPTAVGAHAALESGFILLSFTGLGEPDIAYVEHTFGAVFLEKESDVARARHAFDRVLADALDPADSVALVGRIAREV